VIVNLYHAVCDICQAMCPDSGSLTRDAARRAADTAGWRKRGRLRVCPACTTTPPTAAAPAALAGQAQR
jgi:hypothetical protein